MNFLCVLLNQLLLFKSRNDLQTVDHKSQAVGYSLFQYSNSMLKHALPAFPHLHVFVFLFGNSPCYICRVNFCPSHSTFHSWSQINLRKWLIFPIIADYFHWSILSLVYTTNTFKCQCGNQLTSIISFQRSWHFVVVEILGYTHTDLWLHLSLKLSNMICTKLHKYKICLKKYYKIF